MFEQELRRANEHTAKYAILRIAKTPEEAQMMVSYLQSLDWQQVFLERKQTEDASIHSYLKLMHEIIEQGGGYCDECKELVKKLYSWPYTCDVDTIAERSRYWRYCWKCFYRNQDNAIRRISFYDWCCRCDICGSLIPRKSVYKIDNILEKRSHYVCLHCVEKEAERQFIICQVCGKKTVNALSGQVCYDCKENFTYQGQVSLHLARARAAGTPATLTLAQWAATVSYFHRKCAYCMVRPFQELEHFIPIILGGGTTADNCVPVCEFCNGKKGNKHPDALTSPFLKENIEHIRRYLSEEEHGINPFAITDRALVVRNDRIG